MKTVTIGKTVLPAIGLGTWHMGDDPRREKQEIAAIRAGLTAGAQLIDTAEMYGDGRAERLVGKALQGYAREQVYLVDKVLPANANAVRMEASLDQSLRNVGTDYFDLYLYHWRGSTPLEETVSELNRLQATGKIRHWGVSNFDRADLEELWQTPGGDQCVVNQDLYNIGERGIEYDVLPWQQAQKMPLMAYSPVAQGDTLWIQRLTDNRVLRAIAQAHQVSVFQVMLAWVIRQPGVIAIPQTSQPEHAQQNVQAGDLYLTEQELIQLQQEFPTPTQKQPLAMI